MFVLAVVKIILVTRVVDTRGSMVEVHESQRVKAQCVSIRQNFSR